MTPNGLTTRLPPEILLYIADCLVPSSHLSPIALPSSHSTTKTLLALSLTSRVFYPTTTRLLYSYCLYIDTSNRLNLLLRSLSDFDQRAAEPQIIRSRLVPISIIPHITSLYLCPFTDSIERFWIVEDVQKLLSLLAPRLRRLVADIPFRSLYPVDDHWNMRPALRSAFEPLTSLEIFCSVRDELFLGIYEWPRSLQEQLVWTMWPNLKTLALYNEDISTARVVQGIAGLEKLETLVLTRSDGIEQVNLKTELRMLCGDERGLDIILVNVESDQKEAMGKETWKEDDKIVIREENVPISYHVDEDVIILCQEWAKQKILRGDFG